MDNRWKNLFIMVMLIVFLSGLILFLYPYIGGGITEQRILRSAEDFLKRTELPVFTRPAEESDGESESEPFSRIYPELWADMTAYNEALYNDSQAGLSSVDSYEDPSFRLADYGLESEAFGVLTIPALDFQMPIYLGATKQHLSDGVAHLSQTSLPIGGKNTNSVIAGHRGWYGADYLRYIENLKIGDEVTVTNLWEELTYRVCQISVIEPSQVEAILIQPDRELLTLLTCHPYATGGRQRYLVICERTD